jgi:hypothetical protein
VLDRSQPVEPSGAAFIGAQRRAGAVHSINSAAVSFGGAGISIQLRACESIHASAAAYGSPAGASAPCASASEPAHAIAAP